MSSNCLSLSAALTPYQAAHEDDHIIHLVCINVPVFASLILPM